MPRVIMFVVYVTIAVAAVPATGEQAASRPAGDLFSESFEDAYLAKRGWYDGSQFRIVGGAQAGQGCIEHEWTDGKSEVQDSSAVQRLFQLTDEDAIRRATDFPKMKFNQFLMAPYFGPGLLPHAQKLWTDELAVGTKRIGPLPGSQSR